MYSLNDTLERHDPELWSAIDRENRRQEAASHPSALIGWNVDLAECAHLGHRIDLRPTHTVSGSS